MNRNGEVMDTHVFPARLNHLEHWWFERSSYTRWFVGSISLAALAGIAGGVLA